jgi:hypothetical protein
MNTLSSEEIDDIRRALEFFKGVLFGYNAMDPLAWHHYNAAIQVLQRLDNDDDET